MAFSPNTAWELDLATGNDGNGGGFVAGATGVDKTQGAAQAAVPRTDLTLAQLAAPAQVAAPTNSTTGGSIAANTYFFVQTYILLINGVTTETTPSVVSASVVTTGTTSSLVFATPAASAPAFATGWRLYGGTASGGPYFLMNGTAGTAIGTGFTQTAAIPTTGTSPPGTNGTAQIVASAATAFGATDPGNTLNITAGTGWTTGRRQVVAVDGSGNALLDAAPGASGLTAGTGTLGGALATYQVARTLPIGSNCLFLKYNATPYTGSGAATFAAAVTPGDGSGANLAPTRIRGYYLARGDIYERPDGSINNAANRPTIQASGAAATLVNGASGLVVDGLILDGSTGTGASTGVNLGQFSMVQNCLAKSFGTAGLILGNNCKALNCEVTSCLAGAKGINASSAEVVGCYVHDNACPGLFLSGACPVLFSAIVRNTGATADGIQCGANCTILNNIIAYNGRDGIGNTGHTQYAYHWRNNILAYNVRNGILAGLQAGVGAAAAHDGNAYIGNGTARANADDTTVQPINGVQGGYTNRLDVTLAVNPFKADTGTTATSDFSLNATAGGGALLVGTATPKALPLGAGAMGAGAFSFGPIQPAGVTDASVTADVTAALVALGFTAALAAQVATNLDATVSTRSTYAGGAVASVTAPVTVGTNNDKLGYALTQGFPANFAAQAIDATGAVTVGTNNDKLGYGLTQGFPANFAILAIDTGGTVTVAQGPNNGVVLDSFQVVNATSASQFTAAGPNLHATQSGWYNNQLIRFQAPSTANVGADRYVSSHTYNASTGQHMFLMQSPFPQVPQAGDAGLVG